jgi:carbonic anhydrase/acetyltransferase-like protein (isoleucine patch superfamily)
LVLAEEILMLVEHAGKKPSVADSAVVAPTAVISGDVHIGAGTVVLAGAVVTAQGAPVRIGDSCIIMENAVLRGAGKHSTTLGNYVLVGPNSHVTGATIDNRVFVATGSAVFNGAVLEEGTVVAINAVVHIGTKCPTGTLVPIGHIAFGDPARIVSSSDAPSIHKEIAAIGFTKSVFGFEAKSLVDPSAIEKLCHRYSRALRRHRDDTAVDS